MFDIFLIFIRIRLAHLLSPVAYVGNMESPIGWIAGLGPLLDVSSFYQFINLNYLLNFILFRQF